jgi:phage shock protein PspC (stress-responsive transcriptional regulator)
MRYEKEYVINEVGKKSLRKDILHKKLTGVCAGVAKYYDLPRIAVRIAAVGALILLPVATGVAYVVASVLLPSTKVERRY